MVTHVSDASFAPQDPKKDDLADQVLAKLQDEGVGKAYYFLKSSVQNVCDGRDEDMDGVVDKRDAKTDVPMNSQEKSAFWNSLIKEMEQKRPGVTDQLSSIWLFDYKRENSKDAPLPVNYVKGAAEGGLNMNKTFGTAAMKDIDIVKNLWQKDDKIDDVELGRNVQRKMQESREQFVKDKVKAALCDAETNPWAAVNNLYAAMNKRGETESPAEREATHEAVASALKGNPDLTAKLATAFMYSRFSDLDKNNQYQKADSRISASEIADYNPESVGTLFMSYIRAHFKQMAETSKNDRTEDDRSTLTVDELVNHMNRLKRSK